MNILPSDKSLPINILSSSFKHTSAAYKFYWFISIIEAVEQGHYQINKEQLFARMIANAWYTTNYFNLSFGKLDKLERAVKKIVLIEQLSIDEKKDNIIRRLISTPNREIKKILKYFDGAVPYHFLSPWFDQAKGDRKTIYNLSHSFTNECLYAVNEHSVTINPKWINYLTENSGILKAFCYWNLCLYLQKHNPNVPDIANKLIRVPKRKNLNEQRKFWDIVIEKNGPINCIYTKVPLNINEFAVEHFVPFAFVSHDLIWNLIPADKRFNSSKSDKLPIYKKHFDDYFEVQEQAIKTVYRLNPKNKMLQDYLSILPDLSALNTISRENLKERFFDNVIPLITIAANNGFQYMNI